MRQIQGCRVQETEEYGAGWGRGERGLPTLWLPPLVSLFTRSLSFPRPALLQKTAPDAAMEPFREWLLEQFDQETNPIDYLQMKVGALPVGALPARHPTASTPQRLTACRR